MKPKIAVVIVLLFLLLASGIFLYQKSRLPLPPSDETTEIYQKIAKLMVLPQNETPTLATVSDEKGLKSQPFFANAKNGDKVLIFLKAKKAILYDPKADKIINIAPLNLPTPTQDAPTGASPSPTQKPPTSSPTPSLSPSPTP